MNSVDERIRARRMRMEAQLIYVTDPTSKKDYERSIRERYGTRRRGVEEKMHSTELKFGCREVVIHHNSDFSGDAIVEWRTDGGAKMDSVTLPCEILIAFSCKAIETRLKDRIIAFVEELDIDGVWNIDI